MGTKVETITECDVPGCGAFEKVDGAQGEVPAVGWSELALTKRLQGEGWTNNDRVVKTLCPSHTATVMAMLKAGRYF